MGRVVPESTKADDVTAAILTQMNGVGSQALSESVQSRRRDALQIENWSKQLILIIIIYFAWVLYYSFLFYLFLIKPFCLAVSSLNPLTLVEVLVFFLCFILF